MAIVATALVRIRVRIIRVRIMRVRIVLVIRMVAIARRIDLNYINIIIINYSEIIMSLRSSEYNNSRLVSISSN